MSVEICIEIGTVSSYVRQRILRGECLKPDEVVRREPCVSYRKLVGRVTLPWNVPWELTLRRYTQYHAGDKAWRKASNGGIFLLSAASLAELRECLRVTDELDALHKRALRALITKAEQCSVGGNRSLYLYTA